MSTTLVEVTAPSDMPEGYEFQAELEDGTTQTVLVPAGGVKAGDTFQGQLKSEAKQTMEVESGAADAESSAVPSDKWAAQFCVCIDLVGKHVWWLNCFAQALGLAQVQERLGYDWDGSDSKGGGSNAWKVWTPAFWICLVIGIFFPLVWYIFSLVVLVLIILTRYHMRKKYNLPVHDACNCCDGLMGDVCASFWCGCCTVTQMAAHVTPGLANEDTKCCTKTGL